MNDYISREAALNVFCEWCNVCPEEKRRPLECDDILGHVLQSLPTADVRPVVRGKWIAVHGNYFTPGGTPVVKCSICGCAEHLAGVEFPEKFKFCPNCGADMREESNND